MENEKVQMVFVASASHIARGFAPVCSWLKYAQSLGVEVISQSGDIEFCDTLFPRLFDKIKNRK